MGVLLRRLQLFGQLPNERLCLLLVLLCRQFVRVGRQQLLEVKDSPLLLLCPGLEVTVLLLEDRDPRLTFLVLHQLDLLLLEAGYLFLQLSDILFGPTALLLKLLAILS